MHINTKPVLLYWQVHRSTYHIPPSLQRSYSSPRSQTPDYPLPQLGPHSSPLVSLSCPPLLRPVAKKEEVTKMLQFHSWWLICIYNKIIVTYVGHVQDSWNGFWFLWLWLEFFLQCDVFFIPLNTHKPQWTIIVLAKAWVSLLLLPPFPFCSVHINSDVYDSFLFKLLYMANLTCI